MADGDVHSVDIHGQHYPIRSTLDPEYVTKLARYVDEKMRAASDATPTTDALRLAVLAALNVADASIAGKSGRAVMAAGNVIRK